MKYLLLVAVVVAFGGNICFLARYGMGFFARFGLKKTVIAAGIFELVFFALFLITAKVPLRGGYDNNHDFDYAGMEFFKLSDIEIGISQKEYSPQLGLALVDEASGFSLPGISIANKMLWPVWTALIFCALLELEAGIYGAVFGAGLLALSFLAILNSYSFSTTAWNMFFIASAVLATARLLKDAPVCAETVAWFFCSSFLVLMGRYEIWPVFLPPLAMVLFSQRKKLLSGWTLYLPLIEVWALFCGGWLVYLHKVNTYNGPREWRALYNFTAQLGSQNLSRSLGLPPMAVIFIVGAFFALLVTLIILSAKTRRAIIIRTAWLAVWLYYFSVIFMPLELYPLHFMRHNLYFYLPVCILAGLAVSALELLSCSAKKVAFAFCGLLLLVYGIANVKTALALNGELRTNDLEWQFLLKTRKDWPSNCVAVYPYNDSRFDIISKYFPFAWPEAAASSDKCLLVYKSPVHNVVQVMFAEQDKPTDDFIKFLSPDYSNPVRATTFTHRFYTIWHGGGKGNLNLETLEPVPVTIGFYKVDRSQKPAG